MTAEARTVAVCVCTRNRPENLQRTLDSINASTIGVDQVVVSDDGTTHTVRGLCEALELPITYVDGPRIGLGANRNAALDAVTTDLVLFLDDDCLLAPDYFERATACLEAAEPDLGRGRVIVSGTEDNRGDVISASDQSFLGFQQRPYASSTGWHSIVINATLFPATLFDDARFDPQLVYGYDEVDLASRAVAQGYVIVGCSEARNRHFPAEQNRELYAQFVNASRLYVTYKRYRYTEGRRARALAYRAIAPLHLLVSSLRREGPAGVPMSARAVWRARAYLQRHRRDLDTGSVR
jgi:glycosyltransferase involved in cell wall biosynthesis